MHFRPTSANYHNRMIDSMRVLVDDLSNGVRPRWSRVPRAPSRQRGDGSLQHQRDGVSGGEGVQSALP